MGHATAFDWSLDPPEGMIIGTVRRTNAGNARGGAKIGGRATGSAALAEASTRGLLNCGLGREAVVGETWLGSDVWRRGVIEVVTGVLMFPAGRCERKHWRLHQAMHRHPK